MKSARLVAEIVALFCAKKKDRAANGQQDEQDEDQEAKCRGAGHISARFYSLHPLAYMRFRIPVQ